MRRRGQIFLILTILVITFMVGITAVLLDIQRATYYNPNAETTTTFNAWSNTVDGIERIFEVQLAIESQAAGADVPTNVVNIDPALANLENYITERGFLASINPLTGPEFTLTGYDTTNLVLNMSGIFQIYLATGTITIDQEVRISIVYAVDASDSTTTIITRTSLTETQFLQGLSFSVGVTDLGNGAYSTPPGTSIEAFTSNNIRLQFTTA